MVPPHSPGRQRLPPLCGATGRPACACPDGTEATRAHTTRPHAGRPASLVPGGGGQHGRPRAEGHLHDGPLVGRQRLQQPPRAQAPHEDLRRAPREGGCIEGGIGRRGSTGGRGHEVRREHPLLNSAQDLQARGGGPGLSPGSGAAESLLCEAGLQGRGMARALRL